MPLCPSPLVLGRRLASSCDPGSSGQGGPPLAERELEGATLVRCKTRPGFLPRPPRPLQCPTFFAVLDEGEQTASGTQV